MVSDGSAARPATPSVEALRLLTGAFWVLAIVLLVPAVVTAPPIDEDTVALLGLLCAAGLLSETFAIPISDRVHVSTGNVCLVVAAVLLGPAGAAIVGFAQILSVLPRPPFAYWLAHAPLRTLCGLAGGAAAVAGRPAGHAPAGGRRGRWRSRPSTSPGTPRSCTSAAPTSGPTPAASCAPPTCRSP